MQGDNDVSPETSASDTAVYAAAFRRTLIEMIKSEFRTQTALVDHFESERASFPKLPKLSKQQLSRLLKRVPPDWPIAVRIIKCCTHDKPGMAAQELARLAGLYEAATGQAPKGYDGPQIKPAPPAAPGGPSQAAQVEIEQLRRAVAELTVQLGAQQAELHHREAEATTLAAQLREQSVALTRAQHRADSMRQRLDKQQLDLSDANARYLDQVTRADASDRRRRALWERYALLNAYQETTGTALDLNTEAVHRPGLTRRINPTAPPARRALAVYLNSYRELSELPLTAIAAASRVVEGRLRDIFVADTEPGRDEALAIAAAIAAPTHTVIRMLNDGGIEAERPVAGPPDTFSAIVAEMETSPATVAGDGATVTATGDRLLRPPATVASAPIAGDFALGGPRRQSPRPSAEETIAQDRRRHTFDTWDAMLPAGRFQRLRDFGDRHAEGLIVAATVILMAPAFLAITHLPAQQHPASVSGQVFAAFLAASVVLLVGGGIGHGVAWTVRRIARQFYRGRHTHQYLPRPRTAAGTAAGPAVPVAVVAVPGGTPSVRTSLPSRIAPVGPGGHVCDDTCRGGSAWPCLQQPLPPPTWKLVRPFWQPVARSSRPAASPVRARGVAKVAAGNRYVPISRALDWDDDAWLGATSCPCPDCQPGVTTPLPPR